MDKEARIKRYGKAAYKKRLQQSRDWHAQHSEEYRARTKRWCEANPDKVKANNHEHSCKGGKYYGHALEYNTTGLQGKRHKIRRNHGYIYRPFKRIIAPGSQIHHEWIKGTAKYRGVALVEGNPHRYGIIDVIKILDGEITLLSEKEIRDT